MRKELLTGNEAAAWAARLARSEFIPNFPITPQNLFDLISSKYGYRNN